MLEGPQFEQLTVARFGECRSVRFSPDEKLVAFADHQSGLIRLWEMVTNREVATLKQASAWAVRFSQDGKSLVGRGNWQHNAVQIWHLAGAREKLVVGAHVGGVPAVAFSSDGQILRSGRLRGSKGSRSRRWGHPELRRRTAGGAGGAGAITVWDLHRKKLLLALPEEYGTNWGLAWGPNRELLAVGFSDGSLVIWNIPRIRAQLAEIGLDWQDSPAHAAHPEQDESGSKPMPVEPARLCALELFGTAKATLAIEENVCRIAVAAVDGNNWHVRIIRMFDDPQAGATYTVRFRAKADAPRRIFLVGSIDEPDYHGIGLLQEVRLTQAWQDYQYKFQAKDLAAENMIQFNVGDQTGTVWIADFTLAKSAR